LFSHSKPLLKKNASVKSEFQFRDTRLESMRVLSKRGDYHHLLSTGIAKRGHQLKTRAYTWMWTSSSNIGEEKEQE